MNIKKFCISIGIGLTVTLTSFAQNAGTHIWQATPLLSGYNVIVPSNGIVGPASLAGSGVTATVTSTNILFTRANGQVVYSYSNNVNGGMGTNQIVGDAFKPAVGLVSDANGDINANASLWLIIGFTNYLPTLATNSQGQYVIPGASTNGLFPAFGGFIAPWPLLPSTGPVWMPQATTNQYPSFPFNSAFTATTNLLYVNLYSSPASDLLGNFGDSLLPGVPLWETTPSFSCTFPATSVGNGNLAAILSTNLPVAFLQHARRVVMTIGFVNGTADITGTNQINVLLNNAFIVQPQ